MVMKVFDVESNESSAVSVVGWDPDARAAIFVYRNKSGKAADSAYRYENINAQNIMPALFGDDSLGQYAGRLKDLGVPTMLSTAKFSKSNGNGVTFYFGAEEVGELIPLKTLRAAIAHATYAAAWEAVTGHPIAAGIVIQVSSFSNLPIMAGSDSRSYAW